MVTSECLNLISTCLTCHLEFYISSRHHNKWHIAKIWCFKTWIFVQHCGIITYYNWPSLILSSNLLFGIFFLKTLSVPQRIQKYQDLCNYVILVYVSPVVGDELFCWCIMWNNYINRIQISVPNTEMFVVSTVLEQCMII